MKAEERHRLHDNDLRRLADKVQVRARPWLERYGLTLLIAVAAAIVVTAVAVWWFRSQGTSDAAVWADLGATLRSPQTTAEDFANIADSSQYAGTTAAKWARLLEAEARLDSGLRLLFSDREGALRELESARKGFESLLDGPAVSREHDVRVRFGLAKVLEVTSDGDLQPAIDAYEAIAKEHVGSVYGDLAEERAAALQTDDAKSFYVWFSEQSPEPVDPLQRPDDANPFGGSLPPSGGAASGSGPSLENILGGMNPPAETEPTQSDSAESEPVQADPAETEPPPADSPEANQEPPAETNTNPASETEANESQKQQTNG